jgi:hypothetical protein
MPRNKADDQEDADYVGRRSQIMRSLRRALDDEDITAARKALKRMDEDDASAKRARRAKRADDDSDLDDDEAKRASDDDADLDDDDSASEDDLGGAPRGKKARRAKKTDDDQDLDDDELEDDEAKKAYAEEETWGKNDMKPYERNSRFPIPRVGQRDVDGAKRGALTENRLVRRAMQLTDRKSWMTVKGRYEAMMLAAEELGYRGPNV